MWEPFTERARHAIVRAQEVAQMFASTYIGNEHIVFALAESDDELGKALTDAIDRDELRELLGGARGFPKPEMVFTGGAKRAIELAFENARRLGQDFVGSPHLALGIIGSEEGIPLRPGVDAGALRNQIEAIAANDTNTFSDTGPWEQTAGANDAPPAARALLVALRYGTKLAPPGTRVSITIEPPHGEPHTWTWTNVEGLGRG